MNTFQKFWYEEPLSIVTRSLGSLKYVAKEERHRRWFIPSLFTDVLI